MQVVNSVFSWIIKKRMHQIQLFQKFPIDVQRELLMKLLYAAKKTEYGMKYDFASIKSYETFRERLPIQEYDDIKPYVIRMKHGEQNLLWHEEIKWFAKSSGTTSDKSKFIPVSKSSLQDCHYKGGKDLLSIYHFNHPESKLISGKTLIVGGSSQVNHFANNSYYGDLSAIIIKNLPIWVEQRRVPGKDIALHDKWEEKLDKIALSTQKEDVTNISGVPSWTLLLIKRMLELSNKNAIEEIWPNLELYMHGGVNFSPYRKQFQEVFSSKVNYYETYNASEGFFALQDKAGSDEMLLMLDYGIYYEFVPQSDWHNDHPKTLLLSEVELGENYAILITTNGGLWRYKVGDTIRFTSLSPFRIQVSGRIKHFINAFGEELIIENAEKALAKSCELTGAIVEEYTAAPMFMEDGKKAKHQWAISFQQPPQDLPFFMKLLDQFIQEENSDYEAKRQGSILLDPLEIIIVEKGVYYHWMKKRNKLGGQHKVPRLSNDRQYIDSLISLLDETH